MNRQNEMNRFEVKHYLCNAIYMEQIFGHNNTPSEKAYVMASIANLYYTCIWF